MNLYDCQKHINSINIYHNNVISNFTNIKLLLEQNEAVINNSLQEIYHSIKHDNTTKYHASVKRLLDAHHKALIEAMDKIYNNIEHHNLLNTMPKIEKYISKDKKPTSAVSYPAGFTKSEFTLPVYKTQITTNTYKKDYGNPTLFTNVEPVQLFYYIQPPTTSYIQPIQLSPKNKPVVI